MNPSSNAVLRKFVNGTQYNCGKMSLKMPNRQQKFLTSSTVSLLRYIEHQSSATQSLRRLRAMGLDEERAPGMIQISNKSPPLSSFLPFQQEHAKKMKRA